MAFIKEESEEKKIEEVFSLKQEDAEEQTKMEFIKEESEETKIDEVFRVKQEDIEEQTKMVFIKEESEDMNFEETFRVKHSDTNEHTNMVLIKESEGKKVEDEETLRVKHSDTEEQTNMVLIKESEGKKVEDEETFRVKHSDTEEQTNMVLIKESEAKKIEETFRVKQDDTDTTGVEMKPVSVMEGDSVTLHTDREMRNNDLIMWRFGPENTLIAEINVADSSVTVNDDYDGRFKGRMKVDHQTGCLTITNTRIEHAGRYELQINRMKKFFIVTLNGVFGDKDEMKVLSVMEGDSVNLHSDSEMEDDDDLIQWSFGNYLIFQINETADNITVYDDVLEGRFRDRLQVDPQTGSLNITNTRSEHTGFYQLQTNRVKKVFILNVYSPLPVPVIFCYCPSTPSLSSVSRHVLLCSVLNVSQAILSWYKGNSLFSSTSVSDFSISLSLPLEVEYQDKNTYSCVLNNSFTAKTQHLDISQLCHTCSDSDAVEAVIRLVVTALVGVAALAAIVVLVYDIRSRRTEQDREQIPSLGT